MIQKKKEVLLDYLSTKIELDFRSSAHIYQQIVEQIQQMVARGELHQGDQLPTVRQLATDLRVNFNTVARAYRILDEAGLISTQRGRGTYIWKEPGEETARLLRQQGLQELTERYLTEAYRLGYQDEEIINSFQEMLQAWKESKSS